MAVIRIPDTEILHEAQTYETHKPTCIKSSGKNLSSKNHLK